MSYTISLAPSGDYIVVTVEGRLTAKIAAKYTAEAHRKAAETGVNCFLIDVRQAVNVETAVSNYDYAYREMPKLKLDPRARAALLAAPADHSHDFVETVIRNAGFDVRLFRDESAALRWLLKTS